MGYVLLGVCLWHREAPPQPLGCPSSKRRCAGLWWRPAFQGMFISIRHCSLCTRTPSASAVCWMLAWGDPRGTNLSRHKKCRRIAASPSQACSPAFACPWQLSLYPPKAPNSHTHLKAFTFCCVLREYLKLCIYCSVRVVPEL